MHVLKTRATFYRRLTNQSFWLAFATHCHLCWCYDEKSWKKQREPERTMRKNFAFDSGWTMRWQAGALQRTNDKWVRSIILLSWAGWTLITFIHHILYAGIVISFVHSSNQRDGRGRGHFIIAWMRFHFSSSRCLSTWTKNAK